MTVCNRFVTNALMGKPRTPYRLLLISLSFYDSKEKCVVVLQAKQPKVMHSLSLRDGPPIRVTFTRRVSNTAAQWLGYGNGY